jgi:hypothetical protein
LGGGGTKAHCRRCFSRKELAATYRALLREARNARERGSALRLTAESRLRLSFCA